MTDTVTSSQSAKSRRQRIDSVVEDIRTRMGDARHQDPLSAFFGAVPPSKSLARYREEVLAAAGQGYTVLQIMGYLKVARNLDVCERTIRKFVNDEFKRAQTGEEVEDLNFASKAEFALARRGRAKSVSRPAQAGQSPAASESPATGQSSSAPVKTGLDAGQCLPDYKAIRRETEANSALHAEDAHTELTKLFGHKPKTAESQQQKM